jgi:hypothetical protein
MKIDNAGTKEERGILRHRARRYSKAFTYGFWRGLVSVADYRDGRFLFGATNPCHTFGNTDAKRRHDLPLRSVPRAERHGFPRRLDKSIFFSKNSPPFFLRIPVISHIRFSDFGKRGVFGVSLTNLPS